MTVYVDQLRHAYTSKQRHAAAAGSRSKFLWCHMMADTREELHAVALTIGLKRSWLHGDHYDLNPFRRAMAIAAGAKEVTSRDLVRLRQSRRG